MDERLEDFAGLLRQNGLRISPAEVADAARASLLVGLEERAPFRAAWLLVSAVYDSEKRRKRASVSCVGADA